MILTFSQGALDALLSGGLEAFINNGSTPATVVVRNAEAVMLVTLVCAQPAAQLVGHELRVSQADATGDMIAFTGEAAFFSLHAGSGALVASGDVSAASGDGTVKVIMSGGDNGDSAMLYAGGRAILVPLVIKFPAP